MASLASQYDQIEKELRAELDAGYRSAFSSLNRDSIEYKFEGKSTVRFDESSADIQSAIESGISAGNTIAEQTLRNALNNAMSAAVWGWRDGSRDIVDTGALSRSLEIDATDDGLSVYYTSPYAALVHYGGYISPYGNKNIAKSYIPGRPWMDAVIEGGGPVPSVDLYYTYEAEIGSRLE